MNNLTILDVPPEWKSQPMYHLPPWGEPLVRLVPLSETRIPD